jgi:hypothetical protein
VIAAPLVAASEWEFAGWDRLGDRPGWLLALVILAVAAATAAAWGWWRERHVAGGGRGAGLAVLRLAAIAGVALVVVDPQRRPATDEVERSRVVLLVDRSASMSLPNAASAGATRREAVDAAVARLRAALEPAHTVSVMQFAGKVIEGADLVAGATLDPGRTHLGDALHRVADDGDGTPLAAVVVLSDGRTTGGVDAPPQAARLAAMGARVHAIGFGSTEAPANIALRNLTVPARVFTGDNVTATCAVTALGIDRAAIEVELWLAPLEVGDSAAPPSDAEFERVTAASVPLTGTSDDREPATDEPRSGVASIEFPAPPVGAYLLEARVVQAKPDADPRDDRLSARFEGVDRRSRVLLIAGGPGRDFHFLRDTLHRDRAFEVDVLLQSASGAVSQDASRVLESPPATLDELEAYDAVFAFDPDWVSYGDASQRALADWLAKRGGGLVLAPGPVFDPAWRRSANQSQVGTLLPLELDDEPLLAGATLAEAIEPQKVRLTPAGRQAEFLEPPSHAAWDNFEGLYAPGPVARPKLGATVYAELGDVEPRPWIVEQPYGAGRVVVVAPAEAWRLRRVDPAWFTAFYTKLARHVAQGRIAGPASAGSLFFDQPRYEVGDAMTVRWSPAADAPSTAPPAALRWRPPQGAVTDVAWRVDPARDAARIATIPAELEGEHRVSIEVEPTGATEAAARLEATAEVTLPAGESLAVTRDAQQLDAIAQQGGGSSYATPDAALDPGAAGLAAQTPSREEVRTVLGPPDPRIAERVSAWGLALVVGGLVVEWGLRRWWKLA